MLLEVKEEGITLANCKDYIIPSPLHGLPTIQSILLTYSFPLALCLSDLSCDYLRNLLDVKASLMSFIRLQSCPGDKYPFLNQTKNVKDVKE